MKLRQKINISDLTFIVKSGISDYQFNLFYFSAKCVKKESGFRNVTPNHRAVLNRVIKPVNEGRYIRQLSASKKERLANARRYLLSLFIKFSCLPRIARASTVWSIYSGL